MPIFILTYYIDWKMRKGVRGSLTLLPRNIYLMGKPRPAPLKTVKRLENTQVQASRTIIS